jgi:hypothetical protein
MHVLKVALLIVVTIAIMRVASWSILFLIGWIWRRDSVHLRLASNVLALCAFAAYLVADHMPGEFIDRQALTFGAIVFGSCFAIDAVWLPALLRGHLRRRQGLPLGASRTSSTGR